MHAAAYRAWCVKHLDFRLSDTLWLPPTGNFMWFLRCNPQHHSFAVSRGPHGVFHQNKSRPGEPPPEREGLWREALANPGYKLHPHLYNIVTMKGQHMPALFDVLIDPYEAPGVADASVYTGSGWYGYPYKTHLHATANQFRKGHR